MEPYSDDLVNDVLAKLDSLIVLMDELDLERCPDRLAMIPTHPYECSWCPYFDVTGKHAVNPYACPGGPDWQPKITDHSGMTPPIGIP